MIHLENELKFAFDLRQEIIDLISGIKNSSDFFWNDDTPNWLTKHNLKKLFEKFEDFLFDLGVVLVRAHGHCGRLEHEQLAVWQISNSVGYWIYEFPNGERDYELLVDGQVIYNGQVMATPSECFQFHLRSSTACPCRPGVRAGEHTIGKGYVWPKIENSRLEHLCDLVSYLERCANSVKSNQPRAAIREKLLRILILVERLITDENLDVQIQRLKKSEPIFIMPD